MVSSLNRVYFYQVFFPFRSFRETLSLGSPTFFLFHQPLILKIGRFFAVKKTPQPLFISSLVFLSLSQSGSISTNWPGLPQAATMRIEDEESYMLGNHPGFKRLHRNGDLERYTPRVES